jgi:hypothetical protein
MDISVEFLSVIKRKTRSHSGSGFLSCTRISARFVLTTNSNSFRVVIVKPVVAVVSGGAFETDSNTVQAAQLFGD